MTDSNRSAPPRILLVDDEPYLLHCLERVFTKRGYAVRTTPSAEEALRSLESEPVDVVVSDEMMPEMRGNEFLERVASRWPATVRIMLTGFASAEVLLRAVNHGHVHHFFLKPLPAEKLAEEIQRVVEYRQLEETSRRLVELCREHEASTSRTAADPRTVSLDDAGRADLRELIATLERNLTGKEPGDDRG